MHSILEYCFFLPDKGYFYAGEIESCVCIRNNVVVVCFVLIFDCSVAYYVEKLKILFYTSRLKIILVRTIGKLRA